jgi:hypothetical protein
MAHRPISQHLFTLDGNVLTTGGSKQLAKGQIAIVQSGQPTVNGAAVVSDFAGLPKETNYEIRLGKHKVPNSRTNSNARPYATGSFKITDVVSIKANYPKNTKQTFDSLLVGYDGINAATAISLEENQTTLLDITLSGDAVGFYTGECDYVIKTHFGKEVGETDEDVIKRVVKTLKAQTFPGGTPITEVIDVKVVNSENGALEGVGYVFSKLTLTDEGSSNALARVQAQYPTYKVAREARKELVSTYTILHPSTTTLAAYTTTVSSYEKDCAACAPGYTAIAQGNVYSVSIEDAGADLTSTIATIPNAVGGTVVKKGQDGTNTGIGVYTLVTSVALTAAQITAYTTTVGVKSTAIITALGDVKDVCANNTVTSTSWVDGTTCYSSVESYKIQLKDDDCSGTRLAELQAQYPTLAIKEGVPTGFTTEAVTLTGTSGTANVTVGGVNYPAVFATSLTATAAAFVTTNAAAILAATGATVTAAAGVLTFTDASTSFPDITVTNTTLTLAGTVAAKVIQTTATTGGCQRVYSTTVVTDIVCNDCSNIFVQDFTSVAPAPFDFTEWELVATPSSATAKMGIKLVGKPFVITPTDIARDQIPFYETSTKINVSGGYIEEVVFSFEPQYNNIFNVKRLSRATDRDNLGGHLLAAEEMSRIHFDGELRHINNQFARTALGEESVLNFDSQYVSYEVVIHDGKYSQSMGRSSDMAVALILWAEFGKEKALEALVNKIAVKAGLSPVQISAQ